MDELEAAGRRQAEIDRRIAAAQKELDDRKRARAGKGSGRMKKAEQKKDDSLNALLVRLRAGYLPGEIMSTARAPPAQVAASAQQNSQHHAESLSASSGRPAASALAAAGISGRRGGGGGGSGSGGGGDDDEDDGGDEGDDDEGDDDEQDAAFKQYYRVTPQQRAFNRNAAFHFRKNAANLNSSIIRPRDVVKSGCDRSFIGVGACHVYAPHLYLGLPLPPCPTCGWKAVDRKRVTTRGMCPARRVYDEGIDDWLVGFKCVCHICKEKHDGAAEELKDLEKDVFSTPEELAEARAAVKAATYCYRSYNHESMRFYAERYSWYVLLL